MLPITIGSVLSKVSRQAVVVLLSRGASVLLAIASTILLSRLLGTAGLGQFRLGSVVVQLLTTFCLLGLDGGLLRYLPVLETHGGNGSRTLLARSSRVVIAISLALSVALLLGAPALATYYFHSPGMTNVLRVFSLQVPVLVLFRFLSSAVTAAKRRFCVENHEYPFSSNLLSLAGTDWIRSPRALRHGCGPHSRAARRGSLPCLIPNATLSKGS